MKRTIFLCISALATITSLPLPAMAQTNAAAAQQGNTPDKLTQQQIRTVDDEATLYKLAEVYQGSADMLRLSWTLEQLALVLPMNGEVKLALAASYSNLDEKSKAYDTLLHMQTQGYGYNLTDDPRFKKVSDTEVWTYAVANLRANLKPFGEGKTAFQLPKGDYMFESMAWDAKRQRFLVGSVRDGNIYLSDKAGKIEPFIQPSAENGLWGIYAMAVDAERDLLYVASTSSVYFNGFKAEDFGKAGVFKFKLSTGKLVDKVQLPALLDGGNTLSSITVSKKGQVFAADGIRNVIYRLDGKSLKPMVHNPKLTSVRGLTTSDDGNTLFFADYTNGLFGVDLATGKPFDIRYDLRQLVLPGIESIYWHDGTIVAIEPGMAPKRVIRLHLSKDLRNIERVMPLDAANPSFPLPTSGTVVGDDLYFFADSHKNFYDQHGVAKNDYATAPQSIFKSDMRFAWAETLARPVLGEKKAGGPQILGAEGRKELLQKNVEDFGRPKAGDQPKPAAPAKKD